MKLHHLGKKTSNLAKCYGQYLWLFSRPGLQEEKFGVLDLHYFLDLEKFLLATCYSRTL